VIPATEHISRQTAICETILAPRKRFSVDKYPKDDVGAPNMIFTVTTVVVLAIGLLTLALALYGGFVSSSIIEGLKGDQASIGISEQKYYLLGLIGVVVLIARIFDVPIFFWMLQSLVPYCPGAMCAYGVVNAGAPYSLAAIALKLFVPFFYGLWLIVENANRGQAELPMMKDLARSFLFLLLPLVLVDSALDILVVSFVKPIYLPCCSSIYDVDPPFSPSAYLGPEVGTTIAALTVVVTLSVVVIQWSGQQSNLARMVTVGLCFAAAALYFVALHDTYAPAVLGLSTHHCPYCLFQEFPDTALFSGLFWLGIASAGWRLALQVTWTRKGLNPEAIGSMLGLLRKVSSVALVFSITSMISHWLLVL